MAGNEQSSPLPIGLGEQSKKPSQLCHQLPMRPTASAAAAPGFTWLLSWEQGSSESRVVTKDTAILRQHASVFTFSLR